MHSSAHRRVAWPFLCGVTMSLKPVLSLPAGKRGPTPPRLLGPHLYLLNDPVPPKARNKLSWGGHGKVSVQVHLLQFSAPLHQVKSRHTRSAEGTEQTLMSQEAWATRGENQEPSIYKININREAGAHQTLHCFAVLTGDLEAFHKETQEAGAGMKQERSIP